MQGSCPPVNPGHPLLPTAQGSPSKDLEDRGHLGHSPALLGQHDACAHLQGQDTSARQQQMMVRVLNCDTLPP